MESQGCELMISTDFDDGPLGGRVIVVESSSPSSTMSQFEAREDKAQEIRECLKLPCSESIGSNSSNNNRVDLWELRQLALAPGGLLLPSFRQMAWPLLMGLSEKTMVNSDEDSGDAVVLDEKLEAIKSDLQRVVWNVEDLARLSRTGKESFWYTSQSCPTIERPMVIDTGTPSLVSSPCSSSETSCQETMDGSNSSPKATLVISENDQKMIEEVLTSALEGQVEGQRYPPMLANVAALLMINMDLSTTAASQLLSQMISYHLKAAFSGASLEKMMCILIDKLYLQAKQNAKEEAECAATWFTGFQQRDYNLQTASRLLDAFVVSHPLFPLYFAVATSQGESWTMENVEGWIAVGLDYMQQLPPSELVAASGASFNTSPPPAWALAATASANWAQVGTEPPSTPAADQRDEPFSDDDSEDDSSQWERLSTCSVENVEAETTPVLTQQAFLDAYPLATMAAGLAVASPSKLPTKVGNNKNQRGILSLVLFAAILVAVWATGHLGSTTSVEPPKTKSRFQKLKDALPTKSPKAMAPPSKMFTLSSAMPSLVIPTTAPAPSPLPKAEEKMVLSPRAKLTPMVSSDEANKTQHSNTTTSSVPDSEQQLQMFMLEGIYESIESSFVSAEPAPVAVSNPKFQPLRKIVKKLCKVWGKVSAELTVSNPKFQPLRKIVKNLGKVLGKVRRGIAHVRVFATRGAIQLKDITNSKIHFGREKSVYRGA